jgi:hypothetical protein
MNLPKVEDIIPRVENQMIVKEKVELNPEEPGEMGEIEDELEGDLDEIEVGTVPVEGESVENPDELNDGVEAYAYMGNRGGVMQPYQMQEL